MKKFFKDVAGELKNPSDDAEKVLGIIKRVIMAIVFLSLLFSFTSFTSGIYFRIIRYIQSGSFDYIKSQEPIIVETIMEFVVFLLYLYIFLACRKNIKKSKSINKRVFLAALIGLSVLPLIESIFFSGLHFSLFIKIATDICRYIMITAAFLPLDKKRNHVFTDEEMQNHAPIRFIAIAGYFLVAFALITNIYYLIMAFSMQIGSLYFKVVAGIKMDLGSWFSLLYLLIVIFETAILMVVFARSLFGRKNKANANQNNKRLLVTVIILNLITMFLIGIMNINILYISVFIIAVTYQNKYKVFNDLVKRIFKKSIEKIKSSFNNYLSFKE